MSTSNNQRMSLSELIKHRRSDLNLRQQQVADALQVTPEAVHHWESGSRRIEVDKLPRLAAILQLDESRLCRLALREFHPALYLALFGADQPAAYPSPQS